MYHNWYIMLKQTTSISLTALIEVAVFVALFCITKP